MQKRFSLTSKDINELQWVHQFAPFQDLTITDMNTFLAAFRKVVFKKDEIVIEEGEVSTSGFFVVKGLLSFQLLGRTVKHFSRGVFFGEIGLIDAKPRTGTIAALEDTTVLEIKATDIENNNVVALPISAQVYRSLSKIVTSYVRDSDTFYNELDVLLIQDGGCAPGYNPVTAFLVDYLEKNKHNVFITSEGFKSIVSNESKDYHSLVSDESTYRHLDFIRGVVHSANLREARGANFRSERYPEFKKKENLQMAAQNVLGRHVKIIVAIGGNGTFAGINSLSALLGNSVQCFFIPVTIDSDIYGSECIGENTGVEMGAEKIRCYLADAHTHKRCYIIEMMGARGGYHALHSCLGAGADLAVLPGSKLDANQIALALSKGHGHVIAVAEGYKADERKKNNYEGNAAEFFRDEILSTKIDIDQRIVCESFSRDIRGATPNNLDIMLSQRMAHHLAQLVEDGKTNLMPGVNSGQECSIPFSEIRTDNSVESTLSHLANKLY